MKAYLIDPEKKSIGRIDFSGGVRAIQKLIGDVPFDMVVLTNGDSIYMDDEGLLKPQGFFFKLGRNHVLAGKGLALGNDEEGGSVDVKISIPDLWQAITFFTAEDLGLDPTIAPMSQPNSVWPIGKVIPFR